MDEEATMDGVAEAGPSGRSWPDELDDVAAAVVERWPTTRRQLEDLVRIPSISADGHDPAEVRRSAEATAAVLADAGYVAVELLEVADAHPYVYGERLDAGPDAPTVLLYAHHDVQPVATADRWTSPPFEPTERDGRLYGRGSADDKAGVAVHAAAVHAWTETRGAPPVNVKVIIEGEEEIGSPNLGAFLDAHGERLRADVIVATDLVNWKVGWPALTYTLRGLTEVYVTVRALEQPLHSGMWGGQVPDALTGLIKGLAALTDEHGRPAVEGLTDDVRDPTPAERRRFDALDVDPDELRREARMLDGVEFVGDPELGLLERSWMQPAITVIGVDVPSVEQASNTLLAEATAKISIRLAPGQDPDRAGRLVAEHVRAHVPWGLHVETRPGAAAVPWVTEPEGPAFDAAREALRRGFGRDPALLGCGGTIPFIDPMAAAFGGAPCLLTGVEDPATNAHGEDESVHLDDLRRACLAEAFLLHELAARARELERASAPA
jgi:cysteinylglycine-S-conjugate dipeptidase